MTGRKREVAPLAGAWIEIYQSLSSETGLSVAPLAGAWIEIYEIQDGESTDMVAPLAGAWIEIADAGSADTAGSVAPLAGAWIEIEGVVKTFFNPSQSLPLRERGLKYHSYKTALKPPPVAPLAGAWIEIVFALGIPTSESSRSPCGSVD